MLLMDIKEIVKGLHPLERKLVPFLKESITLKALVHDSKMKEVEVMRALQWLENKGIVKINVEVKEVVSLDKVGLEYYNSKMPERRFLDVLKGELTLDEIKSKSGLSQQEINVCVGLLKSKASIDVKKDKVLKVSLTKHGSKWLNKKTYEEDLVRKIAKGHLEVKNLKDHERMAFDNLRKRKGIIKVETIKEREIILSSLGFKLQKEKIVSNVIESLTPSMLKEGTWKDKEFRPYDVKVNVPSISSGRRHPYNEAINIIRKVFLEMGFQEMSGPWVETAFWGMDAMWIPQDHPMREVQDTFYLDSKGDLPDKKLVAKVKRAHEDGLDTGSTGHTEEWDPELAKELILRQHSTATTFRYFHEKKLNHNCKYFYIANNFRNEAIDATHLPEFGQAEGFIMGDDLTLADLMGFVKEFYARLGIHKVRFKPTFNPYTEPSMECHYYDEKMGGWFALINSGIFRPEALAPYGIKKSVIAWGMGSSRIASVLTGKKKLKEILGPEIDIDYIKNHKRVKKW